MVSILCIISIKDSIVNSLFSYDCQDVTAYRLFETPESLLCSSLVTNFYIMFPHFIQIDRQIIDRQIDFFQFSFSLFLYKYFALCTSCRRPLHTLYSLPSVSLFTLFFSHPETISSPDFMHKSFLAFEVQLKYCSLCDFFLSPLSWKFLFQIFKHDICPSFYRFYYLIPHAVVIVFNGFLPFQNSLMTFKWNVLEAVSHPCPLQQALLKTSRIF